jgi:hypothetical protein
MGRDPGSDLISSIVVINTETIKQKMQVAEVAFYSGMHVNIIAGEQAGNDGWVLLEVLPASFRVKLRYTATRKGVMVRKTSAETRPDQGPMPATLHKWFSNEMMAQMREGVYT